MARNYGNAAAAVAVAYPQSRINTCSTGVVRGFPLEQPFPPPNSCTTSSSPFHLFQLLLHAIGEPGRCR